MAVHFGFEPKDESEKIALKLLKDNLNNEWRIFNNLICYGLEIDLVLFHPHFGVITLEVKGKRTEQLNNEVLQKIFRDAFYKSKKLIQYINETHNNRLPVNQVGKVSIPVTFGTLYPMSFRSEFQVIKNDIIKIEETDIITAIIFGDDLTSPELENLLFSFFDKLPFKIAPLSPEHIKIVEEILSGMVVHYRLTIKSNSHLETIKYFDSVFLEEKLKEILSKIQNGVVFIEGVAGSGKTMLLVRTAIELCILYPESNIIITYNTFSMENVIRKYMKELFNINPELKAKFDSRPRENLFILQVGKVPQNEKFDIILVDEAQDLGSSHEYLLMEFSIPYDRRFFRILQQNNFQSKIIFAYDPSQIFATNLNTILHRYNPEKNKFEKWDPEFFKAQRIHLTKSYRNTYEILIFANAILRELKLDPILDIELAPKSGILPKVIHRPPDSVADFIINEIKNIRTSYRLKDYRQFAVLLTDSKNLPKKLNILQSFENAGIPFNYFTSQTDYSKISEEAVTISDGGRAKGDGWDIVFFVLDETEKLGKYIYTSITRAEIMLYIICLSETKTYQKLNEILKIYFP